MQVQFKAEPISVASVNNITCDVPQRMFCEWCWINEMRGISLVGYRNFAQFTISKSPNEVSR